MSNATEPDVKCEDFLRGNSHLYAHKAKRKKIALIRVEAENRDSADVRIELGAATLRAGEHAYAIESPRRIIRQCSEFTWDFVVYSVLVFEPVLVIVDAFFFLAGPLYNRRLRKQLRLLSDSDMVLGPGDRRRAVLGFRGVPKGAARLQFPCRLGDGGRVEIARDILLGGR